MHSCFIRLPFYYNGSAVRILRSVFNAVDNYKDSWGSRRTIPGYLRQWAYKDIKPDADGGALIGKDGNYYRMDYGISDLANQLKVGILHIFRDVITKDEFNHTCTKVVIQATTTEPAVTVKDIRYVYECCHNQARRFCHYTEAERKVYDGTSISPFIMAAAAIFDKKVDEVDAEIHELRRKNEDVYRKAKDYYYAEDGRLASIRNIKLRTIAAQKEYMYVNCRPMPKEELEKITAALYAEKNLPYPEQQVAQPVANA